MLKLWRACKNLYWVNMVKLCSVTNKKRLTMETLKYLGLVLPTIFSSALIMFLLTVVAITIWHFMMWDNNKLFLAIGVMLILLIAYYLWPWLSYAPREQLFAAERLTKEEILSRFFAGIVSGAIGTICGWFAANRFLQGRSW